MTAPMSVPSPEELRRAPSLFKANVNSLKDNASRLGLTWNMHLGTVTSYSSSTNVAYVVLDGDTQPIAAKSMIGSLSNTQRVYVTQVPPSAYFVAGFVGSQNTGGGQFIPTILGCNFTNLGDVASSTLTTEVAVPSANWQVETGFNFMPGGVFRVTMEYHLTLSTSVVSQAFVRVRRGQASAVGTTLAAQLAQMTASGGAVLVGYFCNIQSGFVETKLSATVARLGGAATISLNGTQAFGDQRALRMTVEQVGMLSELSVLGFNNTWIPSV